MSLRGFADLRTRPTEPVARPPKRRCTYVREDGSVCNAVLNSANPGPHCLPHTYGEIEVPDWALSLAECDPRQLGTVAHVVAGLNGIALSPCNDWKAMVRRFEASDADSIAVTRDGMYASDVKQALARNVRALELTESVRVCVRGGVARLERR